MVETSSLVDWFQSLFNVDDDGGGGDGGDKEDGSDNDSDDKCCCCLFILKINIQVIQDMSKKWQCHCVGYQSTVSRVWPMTWYMTVVVLF